MRREWMQDEDWSGILVTFLVIATYHVCTLPLVQVGVKVLVQGYEGGAEPLGELGAGQESCVDIYIHKGCLASHTLLTEIKNLSSYEDNTIQLSHLP